MIMEVETMTNIERFLDSLPEEYFDPLSSDELGRLASRWEQYAREAGLLVDYRAAGGFNWSEICSSLISPWSGCAEVWARLLLEDDVAAIAAARWMWGFPLFK